MTRPEIVFGFVMLVGTGGSAQDAEPKKESAPKLVLVEPDESSTNRISLRLPMGGQGGPLDNEWRNKNWSAVSARADRMIEADAKDYRGHALNYLAALELKEDRELCREIAAQATKSLGRDPAAMAEFVNRALFVDARKPEFQLALMAMTPLVADGKKLAAVRIAHLRALVECGKVREAMVTNRTLVEDLGADPKALFSLVSAICDMEGGRSLGGLARKALDKLRKVRPENQELRMLRYRVLHDLERNERAAAELGRKIVNEAAATNGSLNNWVWYLMARRSTEGKFPSLALLGARVMQESANLSHGNMDTVALALFKNGLIDEAFELQTAAVEKGGGNVSEGIRRRLVIYRAAKAKRDAERAKKLDAAKRNGK